MEDYMNEKIKHTFYTIFWTLFFTSLAVNAYFICTDIYNARQARAASERIESELNNTKSSISSASGFIESGNNKLNDVTAGLQSSKDTARAITDSTGTSMKRCRDAEETITELRKEVQDLEKCVNHNDSDINNSNNNTNSEEIN